MKNTDLLDALRKAIQNAKSIERVGSNFQVTAGGKTSLFTEENVKQLDPRLPDAIDYLSERHAAQMGQFIRQTLKHWENPMPPHEDFPGFHITDPNHITYIPEVDGYLIRSDRYKTVQVNDTCEIAMTTNKNGGYLMSSRWMRKYYPDAQKKILLLVSLNMDAKEISRDALELMNPSKEKADLSGISFD